MVCIGIPTKGFLLLEGIEAWLVTVSRFRAGLHDIDVLGRHRGMDRRRIRSVRGTRRDMDIPGKCRGMARRHGFRIRTDLHDRCMATAPLQPALGAVASPLNGRPHGTVPGQVTVDPRTGYE